ncbi:MAG: hypothetical protein V2J02_14900, partial [Pseudomonadales bacterium]|nr:hypothetical protein [Pseudomonadales bacterium]
MKRYAPILLVVSLVAGCSEPPAETPRVETPSGEATAAGADREGVAATSGLPQPRTETALLDCRSMDGFAVHCGFRNPEDLVRVPDGTRLIVSEMGEFLLDTPGRLSSLELASGERAPIAIDWSADGADWGEATCEAPD